MQTRGIRNNNPGNIDRSPRNKWQGRMPVERMNAAQRSETRFEVFLSPAWGIRAMAVLLIGYADRHDCDTVEKIIDRWAPPVENDTKAYVRAVARAVGVDPQEKIDVHQYARMRPLVVAIIAHENAGYRFPDDVVEEGLRLAGVVKPTAPLVAVAPATRRAAVTAATVGGASALVDVVQQSMSELVPVAQQANAVAQSTTALPGWLRLGIGLVAVTAAAASIYTWWRLRRAQRAVVS